MSKQEYLNFKEISQKILFKEVLDWLNIPYKETEKELKGDTFIVSLDKNLFFNPKDESLKGSVINFTSHVKKIGVREAASELKSQFLSENKIVKPQRAIPTLTLLYDKYLEERHIDLKIATKYEVGLVKERSIMSGRIAVKIHDHEGNHIGYIGYKKEDGSWFFPKGFKRPLYNLHNIKDSKFVIVTVDPFDALRLISLGFDHVVSLLAQSMTAEQEELLKKFKNILLFHKSPENVVNRLFRDCFIKAPIFEKYLYDIPESNIKKLVEI